MSKILTALRGWVTFALALALVTSLVAPAFAAGGANGNVNGTFLDASTKAPLANVSITLASASARYTAKTDTKGFFQINGVPTDTYTLTADLNSFESLILTGVTIQGDQTISIGSQTLTKRLSTIGRTSARSRTSAFQPTQTIDQVTVSGDRITEALGKNASTDENALALSVPGVQLTAGGRLTIRGGGSDEVGYQLDGVTFTEPFLNGNGSNGFLNGLGSLQIVAGAGDPSQGNVGSGVVNVIPKSGTYPAFGLIDLEAGTPNYNHQFDAEYGFSSPNGRISNYITYNGQRFAPYVGYRTTDTIGLGLGDTPDYDLNDDVLDNFQYRFGKNNNQSLKILYNVRDFQTYGYADGLAGRVPYFDNQYVLRDGLPGTPGDPVLDPSVLSALYPRAPFSPTSSAAPTQGELTGFNPTRYLKFEYDNNLNDSTFLQVFAYNADFLNGGTSYYANGFATGGNSTTGGSHTGVQLNITKTLGSQHTVTFGYQLDNQHPIWDGYLSFNGIATLAAFYAGGAAGAAPSLADFILPNANGICPVTNAAPGPSGCYLASTGLYNSNSGVPTGLGYNGIPSPAFGIGYNQTDFQDFAFYLRDQWSPSTRLKADFGLRLDGRNWKQGENPFNPTDLGNPDDVSTGGQLGNYLRSDVTKPRIVEPRISVNYELGNNDSVRLGYGRSVIFANAQTLGTPGAMYLYDSALTQAPVLPGTNTSDPSTWTCGSGYNTAHLVANKANQSAVGGGYFQCQNYAQQLYWEFDQNNDAPDVGNNIPEQISNNDFTYQHLFKNGYGLRFTSYYDRGFSVPAFSIISQILNAQGVPVSQVFGVTNTGIKKTSGVELGLTTPERAYGFSGFASLTYTNIIDSVPPLVSGEDFLPLVPAASAILGETYRAGYVSPFVGRLGGQYKFKNGFRLAPVIAYDRGYPTGVGNLIATSYNGSYYNLPQTNLNAPTYAGFTGITGSYNATNYVDPVNPGNITNPNIAATRGTPETSAAGGYLTKPRVETDLALEYARNRNTFGLQIQNLFGNIYNEEVYNPYWQPVATGVGGPATGTTSAATPGTLTYVYGGFRNIPTYAFSQTPYVETLNRPVTYRLYYQLKL